MTRETLDRAIVLQAELDDLRRFIHSCKNNYNIRFFKKKRGLAVTVSDYMRETKLYELSGKQREKFIAMLEEEYDEKKKELEELN